MPDEFMYDVFISYSHQDATWVRGELLRRLEAARLKVCLDFRDFRIGAPSVNEMERAVLTSRHTLLILTPNYLKSEWAEFEALMTQTLSPSNRDLRLIPLLKTECELPLRIRYLTHVNFADPESAAFVWRQLLTALGVQPQEEATAPPTPANWFLAHPYPASPHFTGRDSERRQLSDWLSRDAAHPLLLLRALGGFGKSALSWHWLLHDVEPRRWQRVVWWSFYEGDASFEHFLSETLDYLQIERANLGPRQQVDALLAALRNPNLLLILDGFERQLRAFAGLTAAYQGDDVTAPSLSGGGLGRGREERQCISPLAEQFLRGVCSLPGIQGKLLMTTRLRPSVLETHGATLLAGCREIALLQMQPEDAVALFRALGVRGNRNEIESACAPYGYHPLSLRLLAGLVINDLQTPGDIAAAQRLHLHDDLVQRQHHVLAQAYNSLTPARRKLLSRIACFRFGVEYKALQMLAEQSAEGNFETDLRDLLNRGLLQRDPHSQRFDLHPIVRHYAYERLAVRSRKSAHRLLIVYFQAVPEVERPQRIDDLQPLIELYHHTLAAEQYDEASAFFEYRLEKPTYYQFGAYQLRIQLLRGLFPDGEEQPPRLKDEAYQAWTLIALANSYSLSGQPRRAVPLFELQIAIREKLDDKLNLAIGLGNLAYMAQLPIGTLQAAVANLRRSIALCQEIEDEFHEAIGHKELGRLLAYSGAWQAAEEELALSTAYGEKTNHVQGLCIGWAYRSLLSLLLARNNLRQKNSLNPYKKQPPPSFGEGWGGVSSARRALELADETARTKFPSERDYVRAHCLLGAALRMQSDLSTAEHHLLEALTRCRSNNTVEAEADILIDLARLRVAQGDASEAQQLANEALTIAERCGYVLQQADAHLELAKLAHARDERSLALDHARQARRHATCDGPPDWTYKVAYEEAGELMERLTG